MVVFLNMKPLVWDNHGCLPLRREPDFMPELRRYAAAGVDVVSINVTFDMIDPAEGVETAQYFSDWVDAQEDMIVAHSIEDLRQTTSGLAIVFDIEGACAVEDDLDLIDVYAKLGVKTISAVYNKPNKIGGGCVEPDDGLTKLGVEFVRRSEQAGIVVCCSHTGYRTSKNIIEASTQPVVFSHSNPNALWDHPRNISNDLIRDVAATNGVVGINGVGIFLGQNDTSTEAVINHIKYVADLVGVEHVGIALDYAFDEQELQDWLEDNRDMFPREVYGDTLDYVEPERYPSLKAGLANAGFSPSEIDLIMGENWHRVARAVWKKS